MYVIFFVFNEGVVRGPLPTIYIGRIQSNALRVS